MKRLLVLALTLAASQATAQTEEALQDAIDLYKQLQVERARDMFLQVISPSSPFEVTPQQRVTAYLYLGASLATLRQPDSARVYFQAALERDPFADLDPQTFTPEERQVFADAKRRIFRVGIRPFSLDSLDPRTEQMTLDVVTTHAGELLVEVNGLLEELRFPLFHGETDGLRQVLWNGTLPDGGLIPPGAYEVVVSGQSRIRPQRRDSVRVLFDVLHDFPALEDTLRALSPDELLPERYPSSVALRDLVFGFGVAASALVIPQALGSGDLGRNLAQAGVVAGAGAVAGVVAFALRSSNPVIPENIAENARRQAQRAARNAEIMEANRARLAQTKIVIIPTTGVVR